MPEDLFVFTTCEDVLGILSRQLRKRRLEKGFSRASLQDATGVPAPTIARFENSARISLESFVRLSMALGYEEELKNLFREDKYASMEEMLAMKENKNRKRGRRKCSSCLNH